MHIITVKDVYNSVKSGYIMGKELSFYLKKLVLCENIKEYHELIKFFDEHRLYGLSLPKPRLKLVLGENVKCKAVKNPNKFMRGIGPQEILYKFEDENHQKLDCVIWWLDPPAYALDPDNPPYAIIGRWSYFNKWNEKNLFVASWVKETPDSRWKPFGRKTTGIRSDGSYYIIS